MIYDSPDDILTNVPDPLTGSGITFPSFDDGRLIHPNGYRKEPGPDFEPDRAPAIRPGSGDLAGRPEDLPADPAARLPEGNTIYEVIKAAGLRTAWSDKHAIYTSFIMARLERHGIDDFFGPEIDSQAVEPNGVPYPADSDWAHDDAATKQYDGYKVQAIINEINGYDHSGTRRSACRRSSG